MRRAATGLLAATVVAGCNSGSEGEPGAVRGAPKEVAAVVQRLETATRRRDYATICDDLLTRSARERAGGKDCVVLLRSAAGAVRRPSIRLLSIRVRKDGAEARVRTRAAGQAAVDETIELVREGGGLRISALAG